MKETVVGIFLFIAMLALILLTYFADDEHKIFGKKPVRIYRARFTSVAGLREKDPVYLSGMKVGNIVKTEFVDADGKTMVEVTFNVETRFPVREDTDARIQMTSLMGGKMLSLSPGTPGKPDLKPGSLVKTQDTLDIDSLIASATQAFTSVGGAVDEVRPTLAKTVSNIERITEGIDADRVKEIVDNIHKAADNFRQVSEKVNTGEGTVARLINDAQLGADIKKAASDLSATLEDARKLMADVGEGKGALGVLLKDPETADRVKQIVADVREITKRITEGQGALGLIINDPAFKDDLSGLVKNVNEVTASLRSNEGTLGALINDPEVYLEVKRLLSETREAVEDAREQAPLSAFGSLIFGAIQ